MSEETKKKTSPEVGAKATLWTANSKSKRKSALSFSFSAKTVQEVNKKRVEIKSGDEEVEYKATFSKGILSKLIG